MHPKLLDSTITQCRDYTAGDCHGEAPPVERLVAAVVQLAGGVTLSADDAAFLSARLRRLFAHHGYALPDFAKDDASLIRIAGSCIGAVLTNAAAGVKELPAFHPCSFCKTEGACRDRGCADAAIGREIAARGELGGPVPLPRSVGGTGCAAADFARDAGKMTAAGVGGPLKGQQ